MIKTHDRLQCEMCSYSLEHGSWPPVKNMIHHCRDCGDSWTGTIECHCVSCHETFTAETPFNLHWKGVGEGSCRDVASMRDRSGVLVMKFHENAFSTKIWGQASERAVTLW